MRLYKTQYSFRISGNRGYDSNRVRSQFSVREIQKPTVLGSVYWRLENQQFSVQCTGDSKTNSSRFSVLEIRKPTVLGSVYGRYENQQFSVQCTGDSKTNSSRFSVLEIRRPLQPILDSRTRTAITAHCTHFQYISCSARAHHQFCFIQTQFVNVSSLTIITAQVFHKSSLIPIKH